MSAYRYVILGAGAAGLSLCHAMLTRGLTDPVLILDAKEAFTDDRTWCFWDDGTNPFQHLASHCWHRWDVFGADGRPASQCSPAVGYACLRGRDFYAHVIHVIRRHPNVTLALGEAARHCTPHAHGVTVTTPNRTVEADYVFDSRPRPAPPGGIAFTQRFFGQFVRAAEPVFDPSRCTLMNFRVSQERGPHFVYVLPFSPTEALVENTYVQPVGSEALTPDQHRAEITDYLAGRPVTVQREEAGAIPMTTQRFAKRDGRVFFIGTAGGCTKPSSGYTFSRIQKQSGLLAVAAQAGRLDDFHEKQMRRFEFFDAVFLQAMRDRPEAVPGYFHRLFSRVPPEALTAFLSETSTWREQLKIVRSLPLAPFARAAIRAMPHLLRPPLPPYVLHPEGAWPSE